MFYRVKKDGTDRLYPIYPLPFYLSELAMFNLQLVQACVLPLQELLLKEEHGTHQKFEHIS